MAWAVLWAQAGPVRAAAEVLFREDFTRAELGTLPEAFMRLEGQFSVKEEREGGNRYLELPGAPLESYAVMFGPGNRENWGAQARFQATGQGRRFPVFGVSINGVGGYLVQVAPAKKLLEILKGEDLVASVPFVWESDSWTVVRVQVRKAGEGVWKVEGRAWKEGTTEPKTWLVSWEETEAPIVGRAAVWGKPFSGKPIRFDDLRVTRMED